jgi:phenylacetate-CoA ligase
MRHSVSPKRASEMQQSAPDASPMLGLGQCSYAALQVWLAGWMRPEVLRQQAAQRLKSLFNVARMHAPLYAKLYRKLPSGMPSLHALPVVTKHALMADVTASLTDRSITRTELDAFVADPARVGELFRNQYAVWTSSGTSGQPGVFVHGTDAVAIYEALEAVRFRGVSSIAAYAVRVLAGERLAMVAATGGHFAGVSSIEYLRRTFPWLASSMRSFSLLAPLDELVAQLNAYRPTLLATYPTAAGVLADEQQAGRLRLPLQELWTGGESLPPLLRVRLQRAFGCRVRNGYGASEFLSIAWDCGHGSLHVNADWVLLEPVDAMYRPVAPGTASYTTLLTNLANRAQPLIRYDLGDSVTVLTACECGNALPAIRVEGRHDDVLRIADRHGQMVALLPLVLTTVMEEDAQVHDFQLIQTGARNLHVALGAESPDAGERVRAALSAYLARNDISNVVIKMDALAPQRSSTSGKLRRVVYAVNTRHQASRPLR